MLSKTTNGAGEAGFHTENGWHNVLRDWQGRRGIAWRGCERLVPSAGRGLDREKREWRAFDCDSRGSVSGYAQGPLGSTFRLIVRSYARCMAFLASSISALPERRFSIAST